MDASHFLNEFEFIVSSATGLENIRNLILELAFRGKLSTKSKDESDASKYIEELLSHKKRLIEAGEVKRNTSLIPVSTDEIPWILPDHWSWCRLGEVTNYGILERRELKDVEQSTWILELQDIERNSSKVANKIKVTERKFKSTKNAFQQGDVLYGKLRPYLNKVLVADQPGVCSTEIIPFHPYANIDSHYLAWVLRSPYFVDYASSSTHGMSLPRLSTYLARMSLMPIPPFPEQQRIVAKIEELMALCNQLDSQILSASKIIVKARNNSLDALIKASSPTDIPKSWQRIASNFSALFSSPTSIKPLRKFIYDLAIMGRLSQRVSGTTPTSKTLIEIKKVKKDLVKRKVIKKPRNLPPISVNDKPVILPSNWQWIRLGDVCKEIEYGTSQKASEDSSGVPVLRMGNIVDGKIDFKDLKYVEPNIKDLPRLFLKNGDLIFNRTNSYELVGKMGLFEHVDDEYTFASYLIRVSLLDQYVLPEWVNLFFQSSICRKTQIEPQITAQTNQANFNGTKLANVLIPLAPIEEQRDIVKQLGFYMQICDELAEKLQKKENKQNKFSLAAVQSILNAESIVSALVNESPRHVRVLSVEIQLGSNMTKNIDSTILAKILKTNGGKMEAKQLWKASNLKGIDDFYALLKREIEDGFIQEPNIAELKLVEAVE